MKAFEVFINGHRICLAGVGNDGVLNAIINWVGKPSHSDETFLSIGGLDSLADEHLRWDVPSVGVGSEILVRIVNADSVDPPDRRVRYKRPTTLDQYHECLREFSAQMSVDERTRLLRELVGELERYVSASSQD